MAKVLLFVAIMILFGSLSKPDIVPCRKKVVVRWYNKGRLVGAQSFDEFHIWNVNLSSPVKSDSVKVSTK